MSDLVSNSISHQIGTRPILQDVSFTIKKGKIYSIIGPNGCGKSTLLKTLARQNKPSNGFITWNGQNIYHISQKKIAKHIALLQQHTQRFDITVLQLISYGRTPHKSMFQKFDEKDERIVQWAIQQTNVESLLERNIASLSGGEAQRVWIAMALAQQTNLLFLDEPTTYLDIAHQIDLLEMIKKVNREHGVTIVMVLHDMNHAAHYSDGIIVMKDGAIYDVGAPAKVLNAKMFNEVFSVTLKTFYDDEEKKLFYELKGKRM
ncbi:iron ABC transporter ATP-binding protein [Pueribacillus theae]|uniref:Iron ABC transporter ATP-binding protein n=1 Tax=Pueribacillus theae TaxID=2171751 RepID=A0A2U1JSM7_9BACI|nr:ABC transporter ATP-binding protein [Pueribacillus theae]PWA08171.1 iron ABC transporter ATP-binding protein [Pueribacillus theae]